MLHASGEFDDDGYRSAGDEINTGLVRTSAEHKDIEAITTYLVRLDPTTPIAISPHQETATPQSQPSATQGQTTTVQATTREPALVLHVKEKQTTMSLFKNLEDRVHTIPLQERIEQALFSLNTQKAKLEQTSMMLQQRDKEMFQR